MRVVENTTIFFKMVKQINSYNILDTCSNKSATVASDFSQNTDFVLRRDVFVLGNDRAVTIPLFLFVCFDNNIDGPRLFACYSYWIYVCYIENILRKHRLSESLTAA